MNDERVAMKKIKLPRFFHRLYAKLFGLFWLPCPLCGKPFGGHEWKNTSENSIFLSLYRRQGVCSDCTEAARKYNNNWMKAQESADQQND